MLPRELRPPILASDPVGYDGCRSVRYVPDKLGHRARTVGQSRHDVTLTLADPPVGAAAVTSEGTGS